MKPGTHPNSLKNLVGPWTTETARKAQKNSVIARKANKAARDRLKMSAVEFAKYKDELKDVNISAEMMLKVLMMKAYEDDDLDVAADLAKALVEFEKPKLARVDQTNTEVKTDELTDEELTAKLKQLGIEKT